MRGFIILLALAAPLAALAGTPALPQPKTTNLGTLTVTATELQALEELKAALNRQFSTHAKDRDKLVCRVQHVTGWRLGKQLTCGTNADREKRRYKVELAFSHGRIRAINVANAIPLRDPAKFKRLMEALPPLSTNDDNESSGRSDN